jgi:hypothetical protein
LNSKSSQPLARTLTNRWNQTSCPSKEQCTRRLRSLAWLKTLTPSWLTQTNQWSTQRLTKRSLTLRITRTSCTTKTTWRRMKSSSLSQKISPCSVTTIFRTQGRWLRTWPFSKLTRTCSALISRNLEHKIPWVTFGFAKQSLQPEGISYKGHLVTRRQAQGWESGLHMPEAGWRGTRIRAVHWKILSLSTIRWAKVEIVYRGRSWQITSKIETSKIRCCIQT